MLFTFDFPAHLTKKYLCHNSLSYTSNTQVASLTAMTGVFHRQFLNLPG